MKNAPNLWINLTAEKLCLAAPCALRAPAAGYLYRQNPDASERIVGSIFRQALVVYFVEYREARYTGTVRSDLIVGS